MDRRFTLVDLFCGAGGLSYGFGLTHRIETVLGVDEDQDVQQTFCRNHPSEPAILIKDLWDLDESEVWDVLKQRGISTPGTLDILAGGPPCEGFSQNRSIRRLPNGEIEYGGYDSWFNDPRNRLFARFLDFAHILRPAVIVIENVPQILTHHGGATRAEILERLESMGYAYAEPRVLVAADYGVPQLRRRAFFLAYRPEGGVPLTFPKPTHRPPKQNPQPDLFTSDSAPEVLPGDQGYYVTVREAIGDLPVPEDGEDQRRPPSTYPPSVISHFRQSVRSKIATPANHVVRLPSEQIRARLRRMKPGMRLPELPPELRTKSWYFNSYGRLDWDKPAKTITKSCNYLGSGCFGHPDPSREHGITMREAARLQSFPDDFTFWSSSIPVQAKMIGSAVPPFLAKTLAEHILKYLIAARGLRGKWTA